MPLDGTYTGLQASVADTLNRSDLTAAVVDFITLAEATMNRSLNTREMWAFQTITISSETAPLPGDCQAIESIRINDNCVRKLNYITPQQMDERSIGASGAPRDYTVAGGQFVFWPAPGQAMQARVRFRKRLCGLSVYNPCNWVLAKHPDAYLYGALMQSAPYLMGDERLQTWAGLFTGALDAIEAEDRRFVSDTLEMRSGISDRPRWDADNGYGREWGGLP